MKLKEISDRSLHISHFMHLVSAYVNTSEQCQELTNTIIDSIVNAKLKQESIIVSQDSLDFFFVVHPSGTIDLCCRMRSYCVEQRT